MNSRTYSIRIISLCWILSITFIQTVLPVYAQVDQITVFSSADAFIDSVSPDANFGAGDITITNSSLGQMIIWLKFNLSDVPDGAVITSAILWLTCSSAPEPFNVSSHFCSDNGWTEASITYNNAPWYDPTPIPDLCPTCGSKNWAIVDDPLQWYLWDVTFAVNQTVDGVHGGPDVVTIVLEERWEHPSGVVATFFSQDGPFQYTPRIRVAWSHIVPEFPAFHFAVFLLTTALLMPFLPFLTRRKLENPHPA